MEYKQINATELKAEVRLKNAVKAEEDAYTAELEVERTGSEDKTDAKEKRKAAILKAKQVNLKASDKKEVKRNVLKRWIAGLEMQHLQVSTDKEDGNAVSLLNNGTLPADEFDKYLEELETALTFANEKLQELEPKKKAKADE